MVVPHASGWGNDQDAIAVLPVRVTLAPEAYAQMVLVAEQPRLENQPEV